MLDRGRTVSNVKTTCITYSYITLLLFHCCCTGKGAKTVSYEEIFPGNFGVGGVKNFLGKKTVSYTHYYGDKILSKNLDLTQDFPNKILFHSLWEQNLVQNLPKIFRLPEMYSFGKILAQDFRMAAITKILMRRENQLRRFFPWGISDKQKTENT